MFFDKVILAVLSLFFLLIFTNCNKTSGNHSCYDESLVHDLACTTGCPGFEGCDGNTYCNQCEAARKGIGPK